MKDSQSEYFESNEFMELLNSYEEMVRSGGACYLDGMDIADIAEFYSSMDENDKAMDAVDFGLTLHPDDEDILTAKGHILLRQGKSHEARETVEQIVSQDNRELLFLRGNIELFDEHTELADKYFHMAVETGDEDQGLYSDIIALYTDYAKYDYAQSWIDSARSMYPESTDFAEQQADLYFATAEYDKAAEAYNRLIDESPYDIYYWEQLVYIAYRKEKWSEALEYFEYIEAIDPLYDYMGMIKVECLIETEQYSKAENILRGMLKSNPDSADINLLLANSLSLQQKHDEAVRYLRTAIGLNPDDKQMHVQLAGELYECGSYKEAAIQLTEAFKAGITTDADSVRLIIYPLIHSDDTETIYGLLKALLDIPDLDIEEFGTFANALAMCCWQMGYREEFSKYFSRSYGYDREGTLRLFGISDTTLSEEAALALLMRVYEKEELEANI